MSKPTSINVVNKPTNITVEDLSEPLTYSVEAFISPEYAKAEADRLWAKVWQMAGRVEEIPEVGSFITYEIGDDSILIVRIAAAAWSTRPPVRIAPAARSSGSSAVSMAGRTTRKAGTPSCSTRRTGRA